MEVVMVLLIVAIVLGITPPVDRGTAIEDAGGEPSADRG